MLKLSKNGKKTTLEKLRFFSLPPYFPQGNPDEYLNNDSTQHIHMKHYPKNEKELKANIHSFMRSKQKTPHKVRAYFRHESVRYAEGN